MSSPFGHIAAPRFSNVTVNRGGGGDPLQQFAAALALPFTIQQQGQQANIDRATLAQLGIAQPERFVPEPRFQLPQGRFGRVLSGVGQFGALLSAALGNPIQAPRPDLGALIQGRNLDIGAERAQERQGEFDRRFAQQERRIDATDRRAERRIGLAERSGTRAEAAADRAAESLELLRQRTEASLDRETPLDRENRQQSERRRIIEEIGQNPDSALNAIWITTGSAPPGGAMFTIVREELRHRLQNGDERLHPELQNVATEELERNLVRSPQDDLKAMFLREFESARRGDAGEDTQPTSGGPALPPPGGEEAVEIDGQTVKVRVKPGTANANR